MADIRYRWYILNLKNVQDPSKLQDEALEWKLEKPEIASRVREGRYFYLHQRRSYDPRLVVVCGGRETCEVDYEVDRTDFPYYAIEWVERGSGDLWLHGRQYRLCPSMVFCYGPGIDCRIRNDPSDPFVKCFLSLTGDDTVSTISVARLHPGKLVRIVNSWDVSEVFDAMHREANRHNAEAHSLAVAYLRVLLLKIRAAPAAIRTKSSSRQETFLRFRQSLHDRFRSHRDIESVAAELGVTPTHLCRVFRENGEVSPYQYLLRLRMNDALDHLIASGGQIKQTSLACGFRDPSHFTRLFKRVHGITPQQLIARVERSWAHD